jgi:hypothetical protein
MKTYLRVVNPILAAVVFFLCVWASIFDEGKFKPHQIVEGGIPTYFLAKGLFCSSALFLVGKILSVLNSKDR